MYMHTSSEQGSAKWDFIVLHTRRLDSLAGTFLLLVNLLQPSVIISTSGRADKLLQLEHCSQQLSPGN
jgi:hypothetical protein